MDLGDYDSWKTRSPDDERELDDERREAEYENVLEERCEELAAQVQQLAVQGGKFEQRVAAARTLMLEALRVAEGGASMPYLRIDSLLTRALAELGCASCGEAISAEDMEHLCVCRQYGVHATGSCYEPLSPFAKAVRP